jgi:hypothetical protein
MERELKIVLSVFLTFFLYALSTYFSSGSFLAPFFLSKLCLVAVAVIMAVMNIRTPKSIILWCYVITTALFAITDEFTLQFLDYKMDTTYLEELTSNNDFLFASFAIYLGFYFFSVVFYLKSHKKIFQASLLFLLLTGFLLSLFIDLTVLRHVSIHLFFILFFVFAQGDSDLKNKTLRVIAYQYLLIPLLQSFEYFV